MSIHRTLAPVAGVFMALSLTACLGGGGGSGGGADAGAAPLADPGGVRVLTGSQAPVETPADQSARAPGIVSRADSLIVSTGFGEVTSPSGETTPVRILTDCAGTRCPFRETTTGLSGVFGLQDLVFVSGDSRAILTKNAITLIESRTSSIESYGAWLNHAGFGVQSERNMVDGIGVTGRHGIAVGDLTGVAPPMAATWRGLMVGTPRSGALRDNVLQGDAALTYELSGAGGSLDAAFTDIRNIDRGAAHSTTSVRFDDIPVDFRGAYRAGASGNLIQGGFYGPDHAEAAGIFEQADIVGAFGAKLSE